MGGRAGADPGFLILISLAAGPKHGHAILLDIARFAEQRLGPGTLYGAIERLEREHLIAADQREARRTPYRLTDLGLAFLRERLGSMEAIARVGLERIGQ